MMSETLQKKIDTRGRRQLAQGMLTGQVEVLIRTEVPPSSQQQRDLLASGCIVRSIVGNVLSAVVDVARLEEVAQLPIVRKIELSRPMFQE
ncbi:MAG: hypothetical protein ACREOH_22410 [Candidatus Entotheonellia bacterium]